MLILPRSLHSSAAAVIEYLEAHDPAAAAKARARYACFDRWAAGLGWRAEGLAGVLACWRAGVLAGLGL